MDKTTFDERFTKALTTVTGVSNISADGDAKIIDKLDSLEVVEFMMELEEEFRMEIPENVFECAMTFDGFRNALWGLKGWNTNSNLLQIQPI